jgi:hypothetical protein
MTKAEKLLKKHKAEFEAAYDQALDDRTGHLYNQFVTFIAESRVPLYNALVVLEILQTEILEQIKKKQGLL